MTFQEFLELNSDQKYVTLDNFYRDHLYLRTLAKRFYGDNEHQLGTCIFTKDGDFLRSRPTDDDAFKSTVRLFYSARTFQPFSSIQKKQCLSINV